LVLETLNESSATGRKQSSYADLMLPHMEKLVRIARRGGGSIQEAEDLVQTALLKGWKAYARGAEPREPAAWIVSILLREMINRGSRLGRYRRALLRWLRPGPSTVHSGESAQDLLATLPSPTREILLLTAVEGHTLKEAAEILRLNEGTVRVYASRGMALLRKKFRGKP
jgi:DNA-directed RNA polymerase specialized sigma24 family protein